MMPHHSAMKAAVPSARRSRLLPGRRLIRRLKSAGGEIVESRGKGGHVVARYGDRQATVPIHGSRDIGSDLIRGLCKHSF